MSKKTSSWRRVVKGMSISRVSDPDSLCKMENKFVVARSCSAELIRCPFLWSILLQPVPKQDLAAGFYPQAHPRLFYWFTDVFGHDYRFWFNETTRFTFSSPFSLPPLHPSQFISLHFPLRVSLCCLIRLLRPRFLSSPRFIVWVEERLHRSSACQFHAAKSFHWKSAESVFFGG